MNLSFSELAFCFFLYSFFGWVLEVCFDAWKYRKFVNPGFLSGPFCPIYGAALIWMLVAFSELKGQFLFQFLAYGIVASFLEFVTGHVLELIFHRRWWDYSGLPHNIDGFVSLRTSVMWGIGSVLVINFIHPFLLPLLHLLPALIGKIFLLVLGSLIAVDTVGTAAAILFWNRNMGRIGEITKGIHSFSARLGLWLFTHIEKRLERAQNRVTERAIRAVCGEPVSAFARGCCFYKLVWLFMIGAFIGDLTETVFCRMTMGWWMSRSSVVYGPFSIVWGMGVVLLTIFLYRFNDKEDRYIFIAGTVLGGAYEYFCSVFTELAFGTVFWDYSKIPFNLGGRINLLYCFFWGIAALIWMKMLYPRLSGLIEKIPVKAGTVITWVIVAFMSFNVVMSSLALNRYVERSAERAGKAVETFEEMEKQSGEDVPAGTEIREEASARGLAGWLDERFPDERMERIYPKVIIRN